MFIYFDMELTLKCEKVLNSFYNSHISCHVLEHDFFTVAFTIYISYGFSYKWFYGGGSCLPIR